MIANDDLAYETHHIVSAHIWLLLLQNKFPFPFIVSKYVTRYTFRKLYDWPIRIHVNEQAAICSLGCLICHFCSHFVLFQFTLGQII